MRAVIMDAPHAIRVGEWDSPRPGQGEVLVAVGAAGVCAGDMYFYLGKNPYAVYPQVCGHEIAGRIAEVGPGVDGVDVLERGALVVVEPFIGCGTCYPCRIGKANCCVRLQIIGVHRPGGFADAVLAPASHVHRVPAGLTAAEASFAEPVAIAVQACRRGAIAAGEHVLVLGCGPIGLALIEVAKARGARVTATDVAPARLEVAAKLGAEPIEGGEGLIRAVMAQTDGEGMPVVMEATGNDRAMAQTVELVAAGGRIVIVGLVKEGTSVPFPGLDFTRKEMSVLGSRASVNCFPESLALLASGAITYPSLATEFALWDGPRVFQEMAADPRFAHKAVLVREG